jgi:hypothetical protein
VFRLRQITDPQMDTGMRIPVCVFDPTLPLSVPDACAIMDEMLLLEVRILAYTAHAVSVVARRNTMSDGIHLAGLS